MIRNISNELAKISKRIEMENVDNQIEIIADSEILSSLFDEEGINPSLYSPHNSETDFLINTGNDTQSVDDDDISISIDAEAQLERSHAKAKEKQTQKHRREIKIEIASRILSAIIIISPVVVMLVYMQTL